MYCKYSTESLLFTPDTVRCECLAWSLCHVIALECGTPSKQRGQFGGTAPLDVFCQERVEPAGSSLAKSGLKMNKAILAEALAVLRYVDFGQQEVFHSVSKVNGGILWARLQQTCIFLKEFFIEIVSLRKSCRWLVCILSLPFCSGWCCKKRDRFETSRSL